ncbi:cyclopropane fatty acyl phospholipid synthase [Serratia proteamaculans]|jgi:cyclopropane-fatty-acyl-phospholipid synthase|uniref:Cyclopropane fatty acyl phospholipid synthase n=1 Tax=Serratia proteamaculans TaxID=28151 RepID=A0A7U0N8D5_SERPR|nr:cyclopropane fatty acyl phospholipid synthase [Serratia proteamaculans]HCV64003.1 cyclopropane fatty acyl phospholipid synthase [Serratia sp. (in: enterobacteria)]MBO1501269.1 cyclopropane fatty acyl phospholipid synthase [Serratia proteamaculans]MDW5509648.1 cyclopropane fatty acyl phospholipid synthase [Serratia proteamaculans]QQX54283.1 cyclopropane fatty acyl phospholipid synthase [Serratia proteamaculans]WEO90757.1 cyclopropane fatty acyl phospholipid synthase [Serratia proteamaculans]
MDSISVDELAPKKDRWYRIVEELLSAAGIAINGNRACDIKVHNPALFKRILQEGSLGFGESYMDGWWDCDRLDGLFTRILQAGVDERLPKNLSDIARIAYTRLFNLQSRKRAWQVGKEHYDIGNDLFRAMLDPYMQYSCGYWKEAETLEQAQLAKLKMICEKLQLKPGMSLLDIGCGWGGLAQYAAENYGVSVHGVTISAEQQKLAQERCAGLEVEILLQDYRDLNLQFDRIVSVGMFEHVGPKNYDTYFRVAARNLKPDGLFLLHTIGANQTNLHVDAWIDKYIFPNGCLPSVRHISEASEGRFVMEDWHNIGADYDRTLMAWYENFKQAWPMLSEGYSERFERMFTYYLNACAGAFRSRDIQLWQVLFSPKGVEGGVRVYR